MMTTQSVNEKRPPVRVKCLRAFHVNASRIAKPGDELELDYWVAMDAIGANKAVPVYAAHKGG